MDKILKVFSKEDCKECRLVKMKLDIVSGEESPFSINVKYIDVDENEKEALAYGIQTVPTLILIDNDRDTIMWRHVGNLNYHDLRENMEK